MSRDLKWQEIRVPLYEIQQTAWCSDTGLTAYVGYDEVAIESSHGCFRAYTTPEGFMQLHCIDGDWLALCRHGKSVVAVSIEGGCERWRIDVNIQFEQLHSYWIRDIRCLLSTSNEGDLICIDVDKQAIRWAMYVSHADDAVLRECTAIRWTLLGLDVKQEQIVLQAKSLFEQNIMKVNYVNGNDRICYAEASSYTQISAD